jgi:hypothetical protein
MDTHSSETLLPNQWRLSIPVELMLGLSASSPGKNDGSEGEINSPSCGFIMN